MNFPKKLCLRLFCELYTWVLVVLGYGDGCSGWGGGGGGGGVLVVVVVVVVVVKFAVGLAVVISLGVLACFTWVFAKNASVWLIVYHISAFGGVGGRFDIDGNSGGSGDSCGGSIDGGGFDGRGGSSFCFGCYTSVLRAL